AAGRTCSSEVRAVALASLGEIEFQKGDFKKAKSYFEQAGRENLRNRALNEFRLACCQFNLGQFQTAVKTLSHLLQNPKILSTYSGSQDQIDSTFAQDISADLARFMARVSVDRRQIERLKELSPEPVRKNNLKVLAE